MFYSSEYELESNQPLIDDFYENILVKSYLKTPHGALFYAYAKPANAKMALVISSGRVEGADKYKELLWEFYNNNYAIFIVDHQGQGRSYRHLKNKHKGYVEHFKNYSADLNQFTQEIVDTYWHGNKVLIAHSMGGAIALNYLAEYQHSYKGVFLSAPMLNIFTKKVPRFSTTLAVNIAKFLGLQYSYAFGQKNYIPLNFDLNVLTSSEIRYKQFRHTYHTTPSLQLGGVTYGWLHAVIKFLPSVDKLNITIPMYIAKAENDEVVNNTALDKLASSHANASIKSFKNAKHELFFERDEIRKPALKSLYTFCESIEPQKVDRGE
ncbi:lysophospholipase [Pseudoalteromonas espejiana DSM 9414]|uniref:Lysophospholipase L2 n=1 Tax=Pseudoalteromonas espejiana TaxID=28107 RepID=A0A510XRU6_9GAMM|nr:alpha/beta fold hydrolase [Pseudoalteromonas espejiana]ASM51237.1 lysophospholipase [Pseudoalteromonas espejiana DSM 9414]GEK53742.1 lysophospholipase L2 [Pseudoalteromonas espejiana]